MTSANFIELNRVQAQCRLTFRRKKSEGWKKFCQSLSPDTPASFVWNQIKKFRSGFCACHGQATLNHSWLEKFADKIAPPHTPLITELPFSYTSNPDGNLDSPFVLIELKSILGNIKNSAPGLDGIPYSFLKNSSDDTLAYYLDLVNTVIDSGHIPEDWKTQVVIPILKPNKKPDDPLSYRPIALSSVLAKVSEHLIKLRLEWYTENKIALASNQFGFRRGRSTMDGLGIFTTDIRSAFSLNRHVVAVFLDVASAYDNVQLPILRKKLHKLRIPDRWTNFIFNILAERRILLAEDNKDTYLIRSVFKGLPQGSVLSPLLYNIYTADLESIIEAPCQLLQYADDLLLYISSPNIPSASATLNVSLNHIHNWLCSHGLDLSVAKSAVMIFSRKRTLPPVDIRVQNLPITVKTQVQFLGLFLDSQLTGKIHNDYVADRCEKNLNLLRCLAGVWWGSHPYTLRLLYNAIIRSVLDYGSFLLDPANKTGLRRLDLIQAKALRIISGSMKSSPVRALQIECADPPLSLRRQFLSDRYLFRVAQLSHHALFPKLSLLADLVATKRFWAHKLPPRLVTSFHKLKSLDGTPYHSPLPSVFSYTYETILHQPLVIPHLNINVDSPNVEKDFRSVLERDWLGWHCIFTDASKLGLTSCVGVGIFHENYNVIQKIKYPPATSVFTGECIGLMEAVKYANTFRLPKTLILSDSLSALKALTSFPLSQTRPNPILLQTRDSLRDCCSKGLDVALVWIPSHSGIIGNEKADLLAKDAINSGDLYPYRIFPEDLLLQPKHFLLQSWSSEWLSACRQFSPRYYNLDPTIELKPWFSFISLPKIPTSIICRLRLGHCCTPSFLAKLRIRDSSICECGLDEGDVNHIFFSCPIYDRKKFISTLIKICPMPTNILCLLSPPNRKVFKAIADFLKLNRIKL